MPRIDIKGAAASMGGGGTPQGGLNWESLGKNPIFKAFADACLSQGSEAALAAAWARVSGISPTFAAALFKSGGGGRELPGAGGGGGGSIGGSFGPINITVNQNIQVRGFDAGFGKLEVALRKQLETEREILGALQGLAGEEAAVSAKPRRRRRQPAEGLAAAPPALPRLPASVVAGSPWELREAYRATIERGNRPPGITSEMMGAAVGQAAAARVSIPPIFPVPSAILGRFGPGRALPPPGPFYSPTAAGGRATGPAAGPPIGFSHNVGAGGWQWGGWSWGGGAFGGWGGHGQWDQFGARPQPFFGALVRRGGGWAGGGGVLGAPGAPGAPGTPGLPGFPGGGAGGGGGGAGGVFGNFPPGWGGWRNALNPNGGIPGPPGGGGGGGGGGGMAPVPIGGGGIGRMALAGFGIWELERMMRAIFRRGSRGAETLIGLGRISEAGGFQEPDLKNLFLPGLGFSPPAGWAQVGIGQRQGLSLLRQFPYVPRSAQEAMDIPKTLGIYSLVRGLSTLSPEQAAQLGGQSMMLGMGGLGAPADRLQSTLSLWGRLRYSAGRMNIPPGALTSGIMGAAQSTSTFGMGPTSQEALNQFISPFYNGGTNMVAAGAMAQNAIQGPQQALSQTTQNPFRYYAMQIASNQINPGNLGSILNMQALQQDPVGRRMLELYTSAYNNGGPNSPITIRWLTELLKFGQGSSPNEMNQFAGMVGPALGMPNTPETQTLLGSFLTGMETPAYIKMNQAGATAVPPAGVSGQEQFWTGSGGALAAGLGGSFNKQYMPWYKQALSREGIAGGMGLKSDILQAASETGVSPVAIGAIMMKESSGGRNVPGGEANLMGLTVGAIEAMAKRGEIDLQGKSPAAYLAGISQREAVRAGAQYLKDVGPAGYFGVGRKRGDYGLNESTEDYVQGFNNYMAKATGAPSGNYEPGALEYGPSGEAIGTGIDISAFNASATVLTNAASVLDKAAKELLDFASKMQTYYTGKPMLSGPNSGLQYLTP